MTDNLETKALSHRFESLGSNCEFGFALRKLGNEDGQLLRWAVVPIKSAISLINTPPPAIYLKENLTPVAHDMVYDASIGISFHCRFRFERDGDTWRIRQQQIDNDEIYLRDLDKISYMYKKFLHRLYNEPTIFVFKQDQPPSHENISDLYQAILRASRGNSALAIVYQDEAQVDEVMMKQSQPNLFICTFRKLIPNQHFESDSYSNWHGFIRRTAKIFIETTHASAIKME